MTQLLGMGFSNVCFTFSKSVKEINLVKKKLNVIHNFRRSIFMTHPNKSFFEYDKRGSLEYPVFHDKPWHEHIKDGQKIFIEQLKLFRKEVVEKFQQDPKLYQDGDTDVFFRFDSEDCLKQWRVSSDKTNKEGNSECSFVINDKGKGVFHGNIDTTPPKDGKNRFSGYCGIRSIAKMKSFLRSDSYNWLPFTHLELRVKGDGRHYAINLGMTTYYDVSWFELYSYYFFTRGGPYWQVIRIPFSKFFVTGKGRIQDKQGPISKDRVNGIGITAASIPGPFHLEIDYIGCHVDLRYTEEFAYELYKMPKEYVSS